MSESCEQKDVEDVNAGVDGCALCDGGEKSVLGVRVRNERGLYTGGRWEFAIMHFSVRVEQRVVSFQIRGERIRSDMSRLGCGCCEWAEGY